MKQTDLINFLASLDLSSSNFIIRTSLEIKQALLIHKDREPLIEKFILLCQFEEKYPNGSDIVAEVTIPAVIFDADFFNLQYRIFDSGKVLVTYQGTFLNCRQVFHKITGKYELFEVEFNEVPAMIERSIKTVEVVRHKKIATITVEDRIEEIDNLYR